MEMREKKVLKDGLLLWLMSLEGMVHVYSLRERGEKERENNTQIYLWCDYMISLQVRIFLLCRVAQTFICHKALREHLFRICCTGPRYMLPVPDMTQDISARSLRSTPKRAHCRVLQVLLPSGGCFWNQHQLMLISFTPVYSPCPLYLVFGFPGILTKF